MRKLLAKESGERKRFKATFVRVGKKVNFKGYSEDTILLKAVTDAETNQVVTDHIWFTYSKGFEKTGLTEGMGIEFEARVKEYRKGYVNKRAGINNSAKDYKLSHPTKINAIKNESTPI